MSRGGKVPREPPHPLRRDDHDVVDVQRPVWRLHRTQGQHVPGWDQFRTFGPLPSMRYDPHPEPMGNHPDHGVLYCAADLRTALAEVFQATRRVNTTTEAPYATSWSPTRPLRLLDLTGTWALRNGAAQALTAAPRPVCRTWSRAIRERWSDLDGLLTTSTMTGDTCLVLYSPAASSIPPQPGFSRPLSHPVLWSVVERAADAIGYSIG